MIGPLIIEEFSRPPTSTLLVVAMAVAVSLISTVARLLLTDVKRMRRRKVELKNWQSELKEATTSKNRAKLQKLKKKEKVMKQLQMEMMWESMKPTMLFMAPFLALWYIVSGIVGPDTAVAISPIPIPLIFFTVTELNFIGWYIVSSFAFTTVIMKLFKLELG